MSQLTSLMLSPSQKSKHQICKRQIQKREGGIWAVTKILWREEERREVHHVQVEHYQKHF